MKISLFGQFGSGNTGNDGSLESMILFLRKMRPDAELLCICSDPKDVQARYGIPAMSVGGPALSGTAARLLNKTFCNLPRRFALLYTALVQFSGIDLLIIPGTGILDDFQERAFGWPLVLFCWCLAARVRNTPIAFVSIGAGPINGRLSRWLLVSAARMATYRSYRDDTSLHFMKSVGVDTIKDYRYPDIAFSLPSPPSSPNESGQPPARQPCAGRGATGSYKPLTIGVGIMKYRGWQSDDPRADKIYADYIAKMSHVLTRLLADGHRICLFMGDVTDELARDDILTALAGAISTADRARLEVHSVASLHDVMAIVGRVNVTIVSRYHNLVCSLKLARPSISLGYAQKNDDLMQAFGQQAYCRHIETFDTEELLVLVRQLIAKRIDVTEIIDLFNARVQLLLADQQDLLKRTLLADQLPLMTAGPLEASEVPDRSEGKAAVL